MKLATHRSTLSALIAAAAVLCPVGQAMEQVPYSASPVLRPTSVVRINRSLDNALDVPEQVLARSSGNPIDPWGRTMAEDYAKYYFAEPAVKQLEAIRKEFDARGLSGNDIVPYDLHERVEHLLRIESCKMLRISTYWGNRRALDYHRDLVVALLDRADQPERAWATPRLNALDKTAMGMRDNLDKEVDSCVTADPFHIPNGIRGTDVWASLQELRKELAIRVDEADEAAGRLRSSQSRTSPCPVLPAVAAGATPRIRHVPNLDVHYPRKAIEESLAGTVRVRIGYDEKGCVVEASVSRSSGSDLLDRAAIAAAFDTVLVPALKDGKPSAGVSVLPIYFDLPTEIGSATEPGGSGR